MLAKPPQKSAPGKSGSGKHRFALIGAAFVGIAILGGIIVSLQTKDGTLIVEVDQPDANVQVLDAEGKVEISQNGGKTPLKAKFVPLEEKPAMAGTKPAVVDATKKPLAPVWPSDAPPPAIAPFDAEQAKQHQEAWAKYMKIDVECNNSIEMKFRLIPGGSFSIGVHEVTQSQYESVMGANPSAFKGANNPVEQVNWDDAVAFCAKLSSLPAEVAAGRVYRLPTEAEWEYACRAGTTTAYSFGDNAQDLGKYAWFGDNSGKRTHAVGEKLPNGWGLYDMHGNVWEWCSDKGLIRGGSLNSPATDCRAAYRHTFDPTSRNSSVIGFRLALSSPSGQSPEAEQEAWAKYMKIDVECNNSIEMKFRLIPGGSFSIGVHEVTQSQYESVMGANPSTFKGANNPVEQVSWNDAVAFCVKLSSLPAEVAAGRVYRLPTEAEWEYACRAGTTTAYSFGDDEKDLEKYAWFGVNSGSTTHGVGEKLPNGWRLYDMHGNVWEWCSDEGLIRLPPHRGGSWFNDAALCRTAFRGTIDPLSLNYSYGFRLALSSPSGQSPEAEQDK